MGFCTPASSWIRTELIDLDKVTKYMSNLSPVFGFISRRGELKYIFKSSKAFWYSSVQSKLIILHLSEHLEEWKISLRRLRDKSTKLCNTSNQLLNISLWSRRFHIENRFDFFEISFYASSYYHESEELFWSYFECTLSRIQLYLMFPQGIEGLY